MKVHPREDNVNNAEKELLEFWGPWVTKHDLTFGEIMRILSERMASCAKYLIRGERHPNEPGKPGGVA